MPTDWEICIDVLDKIAVADGGRPREEAQAITDRFRRQAVPGDVFNLATSLQRELERLRPGGAAKVVSRTVLAAQSRRLAVLEGALKGLEYPRAAEPERPAPIS
jgi:hypothetical protein